MYSVLSEGIIQSCRLQMLKRYTILNIRNGFLFSARVLWSVHSNHKIYFGFSCSKMAVSETENSVFDICVSYFSRSDSRKSKSEYLFGEDSVAKTCRLIQQLSSFKSSYSWTYWKSRVLYVHNALSKFGESLWCSCPKFRWLLRRTRHTDLGLSSRFYTLAENE